MNPLDRITPKFRNSTNFKNILNFLTTYDTTSLDILNDANNLDSEYGFVLDEIGKTLGVYPRPFVPLLIGEFPAVFTLDLSQLDTVPPAGDGIAYFRKMTNFEYSKLLRAFAMGINFNGTIQEWEDIIFALTGAKSRFYNNASYFGIVVQKDLDIVEKAIIEYALRYNSLTVSIDYIGTTDGTYPFTFDVYGFDDTSFVSEW